MGARAATPGGTSTTQPKRRSCNIRRPQVDRTAFQEGLGCEPCWTQIKDIEATSAQVRAAGIDAVVSITPQPVDVLTQKVHDEGITTPVLADTNLAVSTAYQATSYGMMGNSRDGHSFVLVGPDGTIPWRADYSGAPNYTMYVPVQQLLADLAAAPPT